MANAIPSLSGQQWIGPSEEAWLILDPQRQYEDAWNRAASFIAIVPTPERSEPEIRLQQEDVIIVYIDPCSQALDVLLVTHMVASEPVSSPCLAKIGEYSLGGVRQFAYVRSASVQ
jgi:hypothetical protein